MIDKNTVEQVRNADVIAFFERYHGFTFAESRGAFRCHQHPSLAVKADRLSWYWHSKSVGGFGVLDYLIKVENMQFCEAVEAANSGAAVIPLPPRPIQQAEKKVILPKEAPPTLHFYDYLCSKRGIDRAIVDKLIQKRTLYYDKNGNAVFVGYDGKGVTRFACIRGTSNYVFRRDCTGSDKRFGFNMAACGASERLYIFESPIDAMSHASLVKADTGAWERHNRLSLAGTSDTALPFFLNQHPEVKELVFCLDNDDAGRDTAATMARKYAENGYRTRVELPEGKDFNVDLLAVQGEKSRLKRA